MPTEARTRCWRYCWFTGSTVGGLLRTVTAGKSRIYLRFRRSVFIHTQGVTGSNPVSPTLSKGPLTGGNA